MRIVVFIAGVCSCAKFDEIIDFVAVAIGLIRVETLASMFKFKGIAQAIVIAIEIDIIGYRVAIGIDGRLTNKRGICFEIGIDVFGSWPFAVLSYPKIFAVTSFIRIGNRIAIGIFGIARIQVNAFLILAQFDGVGERIAIAVGIHVIGNRVAIAIDRPFRRPDQIAFAIAIAIPAKRAVQRVIARQLEPPNLFFIRKAIAVVISGSKIGHAIAIAIDGFVANEF